MIRLSNHGIGFCKIDIRWDHVDQYLLVGPLSHLPCVPAAPSQVDNSVCVQLIK